MMSLLKRLGADGLGLIVGGIVRSSATNTAGMLGVLISHIIRAFLMQWETYESQISIN